MFDHCLRRRPNSKPAIAQDLIWSENKWTWIFAPKQYFDLVLSIDYVVCKHTVYSRLCMWQSVVLSYDIDELGTLEVYRPRPSAMTQKGWLHKNTGCSKKIKLP